MQDPRPVIQPLPPGRHAICCCGRTQNRPFCDGSHAGSGIRPEIVEVDETGRTIAWCTCRTSGRMPMCDGSHKRLWSSPPPPKPSSEAP